MGQSYSHLSAEERAVIVHGKARGESSRSIARMLGRAGSTITRELRRNGHREEGARAMGRPPLRGYDATRAGERARRLAHKGAARAQARAGLAALALRARRRGGASRPIRSAAHCVGTIPKSRLARVARETIYTAIYAAPRGALRQGLVALLRQHKGARRPRGQGAEIGAVACTTCRAFTIDRPRRMNVLLPGHWEGDFIKGARNRSSVGVLVCRTTLFVKLVKMEGCSAEQALAGFSSAFEHVPEALRKTLTYDQGKEMALHRTPLTARTGLSISFADPHSPRQRGDL